MAATPSGLTGSRVLPRVARGSRSAGDCAVILSPRMAACPAITSGPARKSSSVSWPTVQVSALPRGLLSSSSSDIHSCSNCGIVFYNPITMIMLKLTIFIMIMIMTDDDNDNDNDNDIFNDNENSHDDRGDEGDGDGHKDNSAPKQKC